MPHDRKDLLEFGPFRLDAAERQLLRGETPVPLTAKAFDVLLLLVENADRTVSKEEFMETVWSGTVVEESNLTDNVSTLRQTLGDDAREPRYIRTVPRRGYRFVAPVSVVSPDSSLSGGTPQGSSAPISLPVVATKAFPKVRWRMFVLAAGVGLAAIVAIFLWRRDREPVAAPRVRSIAVLPFDPLDADAVNGHLGVGIADSLISRLTSIEALVVRPPSAVLGYAGRKQDALAVAREQNVDAFIEGRVRKQGDRIRVTVQLVSVRESRTMWARTFDEDASNLFAVEDRIANEVARQLAVRLDPVRTSPTPSAEAYELYGAGRYLWARRTPEALRESVDRFRRAIELDPQFALAHAGLADSWSAMGIWNFQSPREALPRARDSALAALALDPDLAEARTALGYVKFRHDWDLAGAEAEFQRVLASRPNHANAHVLYAELLIVRQRFEEAKQHLQAARALDPRSSYVAMWSAVRHYFMRDPRRAAAELESLLARDSTFFIAREFLWAVYREAGDEQRSLAARWETLRPDAVDPKALEALRAVYERAGIREYRLAENRYLQSQARGQYVPPVYLAMNHAQNGEAAEASAWLGRAFEERSPWLLEMHADPVWDPIRKDPRFIALAARVPR
jgi:DNA-binding winged helix-turn-helix (wHTH) protein/TolB-like protein/thioredoxin-like negative regulator of GroEL